MNKKLSHFFLAALMAIITVMPFVQSVSAQTPQPDAPRKVVLINQFNRRTTLFIDVAARAQLAIGNPRLMVLLAGQLGIPVTLIQGDFEGFAIPMNSFIMVRLMAQQAGVPVPFVLDLLNSGRSFGQIAVQLNLPFKLFNLRLTSFMNLLIDEINISAGRIVVTEDSSLVQINAALDQFRTRFVLFENLVGRAAFDQLFLRRLSVETNLSIADLVALRGTVPSDMSGDQFAISVMLDNVVNSAVAAAVNRNGVAVVTPGGIFGRMMESQLPVQLFLNRIMIFTRALNTDTNNA